MHVERGMGVPAGQWVQGCPVNGVPGRVEQHRGKGGKWRDIVQQCVHSTELLRPEGRGGLRG